MVNGFLSECSKEELAALVARYNGSLPRYTSYPTALQLSSASTPKAALAHIPSPAQFAHVPLSLYVHVPFCKSLCYFCACNKVITSDDSLKQRYLDALEKESALLMQAAGGPLTVGALHLGGGSPSYLSTAQLERLLNNIDKHFAISPRAERSIELDPRTTSAEFVQHLAARNFSRVSVGVQDLDPRVQALVNRMQPLSMLKKLCEELRGAGITGINFDLIYGLPGQTRESFEQTISAVIALNPSRIALYGYAHVTWRTKVQHVFDKHARPSPLERLELFELAREMLGTAGYHWIGLDHFALRGDELSRAEEQGYLRRNFMGYATDTTQGVLGIGPSSISDVLGTMYQNASVLPRYFEALERGELPIEKYLVRTKDDEIRGRIIERIMCEYRVHIARYLAPDGEENISLSDGAWNELRQLVTDGFIRIEADKLSVTTRGRYFLRHVAAVFDTYLARSIQRAPAHAQAI